MTMRTGHGTELGAAEHIADFGDTDDFLADFDAEQTGRDLFDLVDDVIDDREVAQVDAVAFDDPCAPRHRHAH